MAQRAVGRGAKLTEQLLAFSRKQTLRPQTASANELVRGFETLLRRACGEGIHINLRLANRLWLADLDTAQFQSALLNLVINARDAIVGTGTITIATGNVALTPEDAARLGEIEAGNYILVSVEDSGVGMPPEILARAVEPFFTTKEVGKGSGLGLSQVHGFVRQSNGQIAIESTVGQGTTVRLYLPKSDKTAVKLELTPPEEAAASSGNVLVVEDDPDVLQIVVESMEILGYRVVSVRNAQEALDILRGNQSFDIVFSDVVMPGEMNGVLLARQIQLLRPGLPILLASGYAYETLSSREGLNGDIAFISKPYRLPDLAKVLEKLRNS
jgi:CheY-like chemotaxis protein